MHVQTYLNMFVQTYLNMCVQMYLNMCADIPEHAMCADIPEHAWADTPEHAMCGHAWTCVCRHTRTCMCTCTKGKRQGSAVMIALQVWAHATNPRPTRWKKRTFVSLKIKQKPTLPLPCHQLLRENCFHMLFMSKILTRYCHFSAFKIYFFYLLKLFFGMLN